MKLIELDTVDGDSSICVNLFVHTTIKLFYFIISSFRMDDSVFRRRLSTRKYSCAKSSIYTQTCGRSAVGRAGKTLYDDVDVLNIRDNTERRVLGHRARYCLWSGAEHQSDYWRRVECPSMRFGLPRTIINRRCSNVLVSNTCT